jgi:adenylate cyclase
VSRFIRRLSLQLPGARQISRATTWLLELGTDGYPPDIKIRLKIMNAIAYLIAISTAAYSVQHLFIDFEKYRLMILLNAGIIFAAMLVPLSHRIHEIAGGILIVLTEFVALFLFMMLVGRSSGVHLQYFVAAAAPFVVFGLERIRLVLFTVVTGLVLHIWAWFAFPRHNAIIDASQDLLDGLYTQAAITTAALIAASVWYAFSLAALARAETEALLRNVLPGNIVERLKENPDEAIADSHQDVSVLFADISGFVALSRKLGPARIVDLLNEIVRRFDQLAERHGVEKIKTIGDAYMAVAGVPLPTDDHNERLARMALEMLTVIDDVRNETGLELHVRIGMASGPVMAGVIGTKKFSYDVWGDTVNLASRLEGASERGAILICPGCHERLRQSFDCEPRGTIDIKGVGPQPTWFLTRPLAEAT